MTQEFAPWPYFGDDERQAVNDLLVSGKVNYWTGEECREFEREYAAYASRKYAVSVFNGTVALELALYANGIGEGGMLVTDDEEIFKKCWAFKDHGKSYDVLSDLRKSRT